MVFRYIKRLLGVTATEYAAETISSKISSAFTGSKKWSYDNGYLKMEQDGDHYDLLKYPNSGKQEVLYTSKDPEAVQKYVNGIIDDLS